MDHQLVIEIRLIEDGLNDRFPGLVSPTCAGCPFYNTSGFWDEGGPQVAGGMAPRWVTTQSCEGSDFRQCRKMSDVLEYVRPLAPQLMRKTG
jgi:hypothetical protein